MQHVHNGGLRRCKTAATSALRICSFTQVPIFFKAPANPFPDQRSQLLLVDAYDGDSSFQGSGYRVTTYADSVLGFGGLVFWFSIWLKRLKGYSAFVKTT